MNTIIEKLGGVIMALNCVDVRGKQNCANIMGSIDILEQIQRELVQMANQPTQATDEQP